MFSRNKSLLGLDIGSGSVKAVELTRSGSNLFISGLGSAPIESPGSIGDTIQQLLRDCGIKAKQCATAVSGRSVIIRQVPMAQIPDADLRQAVEYAADKYIPFDVSEVQLDVQRLSDNGADVPAGQTKVLLVAAKKSLVEEHIALLQSVGLKPVVVDVDVFALGNAFELRNLLLGISDDDVRALIDIGASKTNINIMRGNTSYFQREIYLAGNDLTEAVAKRFGEDPKDVERMKKDPGGALESMQDAMLPILEDIGSEIRLSFDYFENQHGQQVKEVYLSGGSAYFPGLDTMFSHVFNLPTKLWDPTEGLELTGVSPSGLSGSNSDMAISVGLASRILGSMGVKATVIASTVMPAPSHGATSTAQSAAVGVGPVAHAEKAEACWLTGTLVALLASVAIIAALAVANIGYQHWYVVGEGLPLGLAVGFGLWQGLKRLKRAPSAGAIMMGPLCLSVVCSGLLIGGHFLFGDPVLAPKASQTKAVLATGKLLSPPEERAASIKLLYGGDSGKPVTTQGVKITAQQRALKETSVTPSAAKPVTFAGGLNLNNVNAIMFILGQLLLTIFVSITFLTNKIRSLKTRN